MTRFMLLLVVFLLASASMTFAQPVAVEKKFSLTASKARYCVGEPPRFAITGNTELAGKMIAWSSSRGPLGPDEAPRELVFEGSYGQTLTSRDGFAFWSGVGSGWTFADVGRWTKTAHINGGSDSVGFTVDVCSPSDMNVSMSIISTSDTLLHRLGTSSTQDIQILLDGLIERSQIRSWRFVVDNDNATAVVNTFRDGGISEMFEINDTDRRFFLRGGVIIRVPYPTHYLTTGSHEFMVEVELANGSRVRASARFYRRPMLESSGVFPAVMPDSKLECRPGETVVFTNQFVWLTGFGGNGSYVWSAPGNLFGANPNGPNHGVRYNSPGVRNVMVFSGGQSAACTVRVVEPPPQPMPAPQTGPPSNRP